MFAVTPADPELAVFPEPGATPSQLPLEAGEAVQFNPLVQPFPVTLMPCAAGLP